MAPVDGYGYPRATQTHANLRPGGDAQITETEMSCRRLVMLAVGISIVLSSVAHGDTWALPQPRIFANGQFAFKTLPTKTMDESGRVIFGNSEGVLFTLDEDGKDKVIWRARLVNTPVRAIIAQTGKYAITLDTWAHVGYEHCLVIYGEKGKIIADFKLEDLLTAKEIASLPATVASRGWSDKGVADFEDRSLGFDELVIRMNYKGWAKVIRISLSSGKILKE